MEPLPPNPLQHVFARVCSLIAIVVLVIVQLGCEEWLSDAKGKMSNYECTPGARLVNGELDYGVTVSATIKNVGKAGIIKITPTVSSSEGDFSRSQKLQFKEEESKDLTYFFAEPSINATGIQCRLKVYPNADS